MPHAERSEPSRCGGSKHVVLLEGDPLIFVDQEISVPVAPGEGEHIAKGARRVFPHPHPLAPNVILDDLEAPSWREERRGGVGGVEDLSHAGPPGEAPSSGSGPARPPIP